MTKKDNKRFARKNAVRWCSCATNDSMSAARRCYGEGKAK
jgi:hypothetical protein